jgi:hypothetical protein
VKKPPVLAPLPEYGPARVCEQAWRQGLASHVSDLSRVRQLALGAMAPVMLKNGKAPIFTAKPEDLPVSFVCGVWGLALVPTRSQGLLYRGARRPSSGRSQRTCHQV